MANKNTTNVKITIGGKSNKSKPRSKGKGEQKGTIIVCAACNGNGRDFLGFICRVCEGKGKVRI